MVKTSVKTIRLSEENHRRILKIQGELQAESGDYTSMDTTIETIVKEYNKVKKK